MRLQLPSEQQVVLVMPQEKIPVPAVPQWFSFTELHLNLKPVRCIRRLIDSRCSFVTFYECRAL